MKNRILFINFLVACLISGNADASENHDHDLEKKPVVESSKHDEHGHDDKHDSDQEKNPQVGPNKGILMASEEDGIKLSPEAEKNFEIKKIKVLTANAIEIPKNAIVTAGLEVNLYRYRSGFYKRIDFREIKRLGNTVQVQSKDLKSGDEIAITGLGFLRIAELSAFSGAPEGHSH